MVYWLRVEGVLYLHETYATQNVLLPSDGGRRMVYRYYPPLRFGPATAEITRKGLRDPGK